MSAALGWIRFLAALWPDLKDLARDLHRWYQGDVEKARNRLIQIRNHGLRLDDAEDANDQRMDAVREREQS